MLGEVRIGVCGHRFLLDEGRLVAGVQAAVRAVQSAFPNQQIMIVTALAEGADRLAIRAPLQVASLRIAAVLPLPKGDYIRDFSTEASRREFEELLASYREDSRAVKLPMRLWAVIWSRARM